MTVPDLMACVNNISDGISRRGKPFSQNTKHDYILSLKIFTRWMIERKILSIPRSEVQEIDVPRQPKYTKTADDMLSEEEILIVMGVCANSKERAIVATVYDPALRIEELQDLRWGQVQRLKHGVAITTDKKTGYQRRIPCTVCGTYLNAWRNDYPGDPTGNNHVFLTKDREPYQYSGFQYVLRKIRRRLREGGHPEIAAKLGWHVLRHTRLTDYARRGMSETTLGHIGWGHRSAMIECYVHMSRDDIEREVMAIAGIQDDRTEPVKPIFVLGICPSCAFTDVHGMIREIEKYQPCFGLPVCLRFDDRTVGSSSALISSTNRFILSSRNCRFRSSHCHTTITFQPSRSSNPMFLLSRSILVLILFSQNSLFVEGSLAYLQLSCPCQKQPCTKIAVRYFGRTISGRPGYRGSLTRYLNPFENKYLRT